LIKNGKLAFNGDVDNKVGVIVFTSFGKAKH
jgi:hypothetical protein